MNILIDEQSCALASFIRSQLARDPHPPEEEAIFPRARPIRSQLLEGNEARSGGDDVIQNGMKNVRCFHFVLASDSLINIDTARDT